MTKITDIHLVYFKHEAIKLINCAYYNVYDSKYNILDTNEAFYSEFNLLLKLS